VVAIACAAVAPAAASDKEAVTITGKNDASYAFKPDTLHVGTGSTVHWAWDSNAPHNVTFKKLGEASDTSASGSYKLKFKQAGTYKYQCTVHGFKGKIVVG
jgi:plastocyanin